MFLATLLRPHQIKVDLEQRTGFVYYRVLSLQFELVDGQSLGVLQLLDLLHLLVVGSDLLSDEHVHTPTGARGHEMSTRMCTDLQL